MHLGSHATILLLMGISEPRLLSHSLFSFCMASSLLPRGKSATLCFMTLRQAMFLKRTWRSGLKRIPLLLRARRYLTRYWHFGRLTGCAFTLSVTADRFR